MIKKCMHWAGVLWTIVLVLPAAAQGYPTPWPGNPAELNNAQKRRAHVPFVRALTDCFARAIGASIPALDMAREGRWYDAIRATGDACNYSAIAMIREHDRLYGLNTGQSFYNGPYAQGLPRALGARLKGDIERRSMAVARIEAEKKQQVETTQRSFALLRDRMYDCTTKELINLVASSETAEVLATAAMTICGKEVEQALDAAIENYRAYDNPPSNSDLMAFRNELRATIRREVVTNAVQVRAAAQTAAKLTPPAPSKAAQPESVALQRTMEECLRTTSRAREGRLVDQEKLIQAMLDLCRPEIENTARSAYLSDPSIPLDKSRETALETALNMAKALVGAQ